MAKSFAAYLNFLFPKRRRRHSVSIAKLFMETKKLYSSWDVFQETLGGDVAIDVLRNRFRHYCTVSARAKLRRQNGESVGAAILSPILMTGYLVVMATLFKSLWAGVLSIPIAAVPLLFVLRLVVRTSASVADKFLRFCMLIGIILFVGGLYLDRYTHLGSIGNNISWPSIIGGVGLFLAGVLGLSFGVLSLFVFLFKVYNRTVCPDAELFEMLRQAFVRVSARQKRMASFSQRQAIMRNFEEAAALLTYGFPRRMKIPDATASATFRARCKEAGKVLLEYEIWVSLPSASTFVDLKKRISSLMLVVLTGEYDRLPVRGPNHHKFARNSYIKRIGNGGRTLVVAAIPYACVELAYLSGLKIDQALKGGLVVVSVIWAAVALIGLIDPLYRTRINAVREFASMLKGDAK
ncbi:MAG: hypothetical protein ACRDS0_03880 [Pseudonocardiaceae bacterium]